MFDAMLEISLFAVPIAVASFVGGFFAAKALATKAAKAVVSAQQGSPAITAPPAERSAPSELLLKKLQLRIIELEKMLEMEKERSQKWELLAELKVEQAPVQITASTSNTDLLPTTSSDWTILVLKQRIKELEKEKAKTGS